MESKTKRSKFIVKGRLSIPVNMVVFHTETSEAALAYVSDKLNNRTLNGLDGDIYTSDGSSLPIIAPECEIEWFDATEENTIKI
ncbi:hypothetical protein [Paenibacillus sp. FSL H7-0331]|uniref:hypothetical protein n=1 Tax=Paenibacillus sp. FSL H7-0331 TaxID=1920421 RepID=UPI00096E2275|nr:hypothetical protein [Paenibacillus sp. FSL H7-0331]OME97330.1 hypothetical protein BK127_40940 [Paenibacillus sp. FSL H7-0331]